MKRKKKGSSLILPAGSRVNGATRDRMQGFARELVECGIPPHQVRHHLHSMLTTDIPRQCACGQLHGDATTLSYFQQPHTNTLVLWSKCPECVAIDNSGSPESRLEVEQLHARRVQQWASGLVEPEGVVIIFTFGRPLKREVGRL